MLQIVIVLPHSFPIRPPLRPGLSVPFCLDVLIYHIIGHLGEGYSEKLVFVYVTGLSIGRDFTPAEDAVVENRHICPYACVCACANMCVSECVYVCVCVTVCECVHECVCVYECVCMSVCMSVRIYIYTCTCIHFYS